MTLLEDYRRSIEFPPPSNQEGRRLGSRQLAPLSSDESSRRTPESPPSACDSSSPKAARAVARQRGRKLRAASTVKLDALSGVGSLGPVTFGDKQDEEAPSNQQDTARSRTQTKLQSRCHASQRQNVTTPTILERLAQLAASAEQGHANGGTAARMPADVPLQLLYGARVDLRRWSVLVSDRTLRRLAAHNHRLASSHREQQELRRLLLGRRGEQDEPAVAVDTRMQSTEALLLNGANEITDVGLAAIALASPTLKELALAGAVRVTDAALRLLGERFPNLERLDASMLPGVRSAGLAALVDSCGASLTHLALTDSAQLGEWVLRRCLYAAPHLTNLDLARCPQVNDELLETLAAQCPLLTVLVLSSCLHVSDRGVVRVAQRCSRLQRLALDRPADVRGSEPITDASCAVLGEHCRGLRDVSLAGCTALTDAGVQWLAAGCSQLTRLDLSGALALTDAACAALGARCSELQALRLNGVKGVSDVGLRLLAAGCAKLELLHASNLYLVSDGSNRDFGLEGLRAIAAGCCELQELVLNGCFQLQERALVAVGSSCSALRRLSLQACPDITLAAITAVLRGCQRLETLDLSGVQRCDDRVLRAVARHGSALRRLCVADCERVGDAGLRALAAQRADQLELLDLSGCVRVSDAGLNALCDAFRRPRLAHLLLAGCALVTQDPVARLAFICPLLLTLSVHGCRVSARVLQSLSSSWPFGELRLPPAGRPAGARDVDMGIFPAPRAKDRRFVAEFAASWAAAATIQNLYRSREARRRAQGHREVALRHAVARRLQSVWRGRQARREALLRRVLVSSLERSATLIQRRYRATRQARRAHNQLRNELEKQLERAAVLVQRRYRGIRASRVARAVVARRRRELERETRAAIQVQRRFRGAMGRDKLRVLQATKAARVKRDRAASVAIQRVFRGHQGRLCAQELRRQRQEFLELQQRCAVRVQAQFRRVRAVHELKQRRNAVTNRELAATKLQTIFRARRGRQAAGLLALAQQRRLQDQAARRVQHRWRARHDRLALAISAEARRQREKKRCEAAVVLQRATRSFLVRQRARGIVQELLAVQRRDQEMQRWASTLVQAHWRRREACRQVRDERRLQRTRWKQLVDAHNHHGAGYGAPFFYNQVNSEIRWRLPRELLTLTQRPTCAQCETPESASIECATCTEFFCDECDGVVHGGGKRRQHDKRELFDFYGRRRDYGDGVFPSVWPSEILQDAARGYDFETLAPRDNYADLLQEIAQFVPVATGNWDDDDVVRDSTAVSVTADNDGSSLTVGPAIHLLYREHDLDEHGASLWESFYDYAQEQYRYYHRISKRVVTQAPGQGQSLWTEQNESVASD